jgi:hypothetical protein
MLKVEFLKIAYVCKRKIKERRFPLMKKTFLEALERVRFYDVENRLEICKFFGHEIGLDKGSKKKIEEGLEELVISEYHKWKKIKSEKGNMKYRNYCKMIEEKEKANRAMDIELVENGTVMLAVFGNKSFGSIPLKFYQKLVSENDINIYTQVCMLGRFSGLKGGSISWDKSVYNELY